MKYNFDLINDRTNTSSLKWEKSILKERFGREDLLSMWVADGDIKTSPLIIEAMKERVEHGIFGYTMRDEEYFEAIIRWNRDRHNYHVKKEWICHANGVVEALNIIMQNFFEKGDKILIQEPVYYPFRESIEQNGLECVSNNLKNIDNKYYIDFEDLENKFKQDEVKGMILCNPHNPVSRVWTKEELKKIGDLSLKYNVLILSDDIHYDIVYKKDTHTIISTLSKEIANNTILLTSPTKTFNLAGISSSVIIIENEILRKKYIESIKKTIDTSPNSIMGVALKVAYTKCDDWVEELLKYYYENIRIIKEFVQKELPKIKIIEPEATYLVWLDFREYNLSREELDSMIINEAKIALDSGYWFGNSGEGYMRINVSCPKSVVYEALERIKKVFKDK